MKAGQKKLWHGEIRYNEFIADQKKFRDTELENITFAWKPEAIIFVFTK
jgi:hypothetical protein